MATTITVDDLSKLKVHAAAALMPEMEGADLDALVADIRKTGLLRPIVMHEGKLLDGRNRLAACLRAEVAPRFVEWRPRKGLTPTSWVMSTNVERRHLTDQQRALIGARAKELYAEEGKERRRKLSGTRRSPGEQVGADRRQPRAPKAAKKAARDLKVSPRMVERATTVLTSGDPALIAAVERNEVALTPAAEVAKLLPERQRQLLKAGEVTEASVRAMKANGADPERPTPLNAYEMAEKLKRPAPDRKRDIEALHQVLYTVRSVRKAWSLLIGRWDAEQLADEEELAMLPATKVSRERNFLGRLDELARDFEEMAKAFGESK